MISKKYISLQRVSICYKYLYITKKIKQLFTFSAFAALHLPFPYTFLHMYILCIFDYVSFEVTSNILCMHSPQLKLVFLGDLRNAHFQTHFFGLNFNENCNKAQAPSHYGSVDVGMTLTLSCSDLCMYVWKYKYCMYWTTMYVCTVVFICAMYTLI